MINPNYDPMQDLEDCMFAINNINELVNKLIAVHNSLAEENAKLLQLNQATNRRIDQLQKQLIGLRSTVNNAK